VNVLVVSDDPAVRELMSVVARSASRAVGGDVHVVTAKDGVQGIRLAWRDVPEVVIADQISSRAGGFALARDLTCADPRYPGRVVVLLDRSQDEWLARWSGADAWFVKPVDPFALADTVAKFAQELAEPAR
jgi:DNA-binding NarL/FixJ family response regulator